MSQKLLADGFKWESNKFNFTKISYKTIMETGTKDTPLKLMLIILKNYPQAHSDKPQRMKIDKCEKLACNFHNKKNYVIHRKVLKQTLDHGLILDIVHGVIRKHS